MSEIYTHCANCRQSAWGIHSRCPYCDSRDVVVHRPDPNVAPVAYGEWSLEECIEYLQEE